MYSAWNVMPFSSFQAALKQARNNACRTIEHMFLAAIQCHHSVGRSLLPFNQSILFRALWLLHCLRGTTNSIALFCSRFRFHQAASLCRLPYLWLVSNAVWPAAHAINFRHVPSEHRVLFVNGVSVLWNVVVCGVVGRGSSPARQAAPEEPPLTPDWQAPLPGTDRVAAQWARARCTSDGCACRAIS